MYQTLISYTVARSHPFGAPESKFLFIANINSNFENCYIFVCLLFVKKFVIVFMTFFSELIIACVWIKISFLYYATRKQKNVTDIRLNIANLEIQNFSFAEHCASKTGARLSRRGNDVCEIRTSLIICVNYYLRLRARAIIRS